jgi:hypothetical protein
MLDIVYSLNSTHLYNIYMSTNGNTLHDKISAFWKIRMADWIKHRNSNNAVTGLWIECWLIAWVTVKRIVQLQCAKLFSMYSHQDAGRLSVRPSIRYIQARNGTRLGVVGMRRLPVAIDLFKKSALWRILRIDTIIWPIRQAKWLCGVFLYPQTTSQGRLFKKAFIYLFIYLFNFAIIMHSWQVHHNSMVPITVGPLILNR